ncbi:MAG: FAD-dependent oxidoreductase [Pseudomonadota bacterium]
MASAEVTIYGAGIFGLSIAWACQQRGAQVCVIDPGGPGAGSSGGIVGALAPHVPENWNEKKAFQLDSLVMAQAFWDEVDTASGLSAGYARTGRVQPIPDDRSLERAHQRTAGAASLWQGQATWEVTQNPPGSITPASPTGWYIFDTLSARLHPRRACESLASALRARGGEVIPDGPTQGHIIHATGAAGLIELSKDRPRMIGNGVKGQAALLDFDAKTAPQLFVDGLHIVPHADGTTAIGSTSERDYTSPDSTDALLDVRIEDARTALPELRNAKVIERWAGLRPRSRSRAPMLGAHPLRAGEYIANGGFKIGFGMAPKVAQVMADLVLEGQDRIPDGFKPDANL